MASQDKKLPEKLLKEKRKLEGLVTEAFNGAQKYFGDRERARLRFEGIDLDLRTQKERWQNKYISPLPQTAINQKASFLTEALLGDGENFIEAQTLDNKEQDDQAVALTRLLNYYFKNIDLTEITQKYHADLLIEGSAIYRVFYDYQEHEVEIEGPEVLTANAETGELSLKKSVKKVVQVDRDQPNFEPVKLNNFWIDPLADSIDGARYMVYRQLIPMSILTEMSKDETWGIKNLNFVKEEDFPKRNFGKLTGTSRGPASLSARKAEYDVDAIRQQNSNIMKENPIVELLWIYTPYKIQLVGNGIPLNKPTRKYQDIRYPFVDTPNQPKTGEFWGRSDIDQIQANVKHHEEMVNLIIDNYKMHLRPQRLIENTVDAKTQKRLEFAEPGSIVKVPDLDSIRDVRPDSFDTTAVNFAEGFLEEAKKSIAVNNLMEGVNPGSGIRSEGSLELFQQIGATRTSVLLKSLMRTYEKVGRMFIQLTKQFADDTIAFTYTNNLGDTIPQVLDRTKLPGNVDVKIRVGAIADPKRTQRVQEQLNVVAAVIQADPQGVFNSQAAMMEILAGSRLFEDPKSFFAQTAEDAQAVQDKNIIAAEAVGKAKPTVPRPQSPATQAAAQASQQGQFPGEAPPASSDIQRPGEGNIEGNNQFS